MRIHVSNQKALGSGFGEIAPGGRTLGVPRVGSAVRVVDSHHGAPREGGRGPKIGHLVLYKLAGFCHADTPP